MKSQIKKLGTIDCDLVETNPVVFKNRLYRFEYVRPGYAYNDTGDSYYRFIDHETGEPPPPFGHGYHMGCAYVENDTAYVTTVDTWDGEIIDIFASKDLENWESWNALTLPGYGMFNTSLCKTDDNYVLMFEVGKPPEIAGQRFTARFATSTDLKNWELSPPNARTPKTATPLPTASVIWMATSTISTWKRMKDTNSASSAPAI